jgi:hypothetical protein
MEREDSFEAIVAKADYEVNRSQLLCLSSFKSLLALATFSAALVALRHPKSQHLSHTVVGISSYEGVVGSAAGCSGPRGTGASSRGTPLKATLGRAPS